MTRSPFHFIHSRTARQAGAGYNVAKTVVQTVFMWGVFLFLFPFLAYRLEPFIGLAPYRFASPFGEAVGITIFTVGGIFAETHGILMAIHGAGTPLPLDCPRQLILVGAYRYVRNPMSIGSLAQGFGVGLFLGSPLVLAYALAGVFVWNYLARPWEEEDLEERFGQPYHHYRTHVHCWIPRLHPYTPDETP